MKRIVLSALAVVPFLGFAQEAPYSIKGKIGSLNKPAKVYFITKGNNVDSANVVNGAFEFKGNTDEPQMGTLVLDHKGAGLRNITPGSADMLRLYVEKGVSTVTGKDSVKKATVSGKINADNAKLTSRLKGIDAEMAALTAEYRAASPEQRKSEAFMEQINAKEDAITAKRNGILTTFIKENPASYVSVIGVAQMAGGQPDAAVVEPLVKALSPAMQATSPIKAIYQQLAAAKKTAVGVQAIEFTQNDVDGKPVKLSDFRGKYVLIDFWASWCGPCRGENPNVVKAFNTYKDKNFTVLGVSLDRSKDAWVKAIKDDGLAWTQVSDLKFWNNEVAAMYGVRAIPQNFLIDPSGKIVGKNLRGSELQAKLAELIH